jgi:hypothetical protein
VRLDLAVRVYKLFQLLDLSLALKTEVLSQSVQGTGICSSWCEVQMLMAKPHVGLFQKSNTESDVAVCQNTFTDT